MLQAGAAAVDQGDDAGHVLDGGGWRGGWSLGCRGGGAPDQDAHPVQLIIGRVGFAEKRMREPLIAFIQAAEVDRQGVAGVRRQHDGGGGW